MTCDYSVNLMGEESMKEENYKKFYKCPVKNCNKGYPLNTSLNTHMK